MYACVCFWSSFQFKEKVCVKRNKVVALRSEENCSACWKWKIYVAPRLQKPLTVVVDGLRHHRAQLEDLPRGQSEGGLEAEPHWIQVKLLLPHLGLRNCSQDTAGKRERHTSQATQHRFLSCVGYQRFNWVRGESVRVSVQSKLSGIESVRLSWKIDQTETYFKRVLWGTKLTETCLKNCLFIFYFIQAWNELILPVNTDGDLWGGASVAALVCFLLWQQI